MSNQKTEQHEEIDVKDIHKAIGRYIVLWRKGSKQVAKVLGVNGEFFDYQMITGEDKDNGKTYTAKMLAKTIFVYDEDNLVLATV
jgi:hypothetical protein